MAFIEYNLVKKEVSDLIDQAIAKEFDKKYSSYRELSSPPKADMGEYAFGCFPLTKEFKKAPNQIAKDLELIINSNLAAGSAIKKSQAFGPYLNIFLDFNSLAQSTLESILDESYFEIELTKNSPKTMIEFSQPNTHKELHVGHMRNLCLGSAIVNLHKYCGFPTIATTFPGDVGTHVAKCLWYFKHHNLEEVPNTNKGAWLGTLYTKGNNLLEEQKGSEKEDQNRLELTKILKELEDKKGEYYELWKDTRQWSIDLMKEIYNWAQVDFDIWYWESDVDSDSIELVKEYQEKGLFIE